MRSLFLLVLLLGQNASAQSVPAKPTELDRALKDAYLGFIKTSAPLSPAAREISKFYAANPGLDIRFPDPSEFQARYAGPGTPPVELIRAYYDPRLEVIVVPRTGELEGVWLEAVRAGPKLDKILAVRANDILHESFHARLDKKFGFKVVDVMEDELLANWKEAQFLSIARQPGADILRAARDHLRLEELKERGAARETIAALEKAEESAAEKFGPDELDDAVKVARFKRGAPYFRKSVLALYGGAGQGKTSIFTPRAQAEAALRRALDRPGLPDASREAVLVQLSLWSNAERVEKVRDYFRGEIPELLR